MSDARRTQEEAWERFAQEDPEFYIAHRWTGDVFYSHGAEIVEAAVAWAGVPRRGRALDIGCGLGRMTRALDDVFDEAIGADISDTMLAQAAQRLADRPSITWARIVDGRLPAQDGSCDFVFTYDVFQHIDDPAVVEGYIREVARILRPEGRAAVHVDTQQRSPLRRLAYLVPEGLLPRAQRRYIRRYPLAPGAPRAMAERAGLRVLEESKPATRFHQLLLTPAR